MTASLLAVAVMTGMLSQPVAVAPQTTLRTAGPGAREIGDLWNVMLVLGTLITIVVVVLLGVALFRRRRADELPPEADRPPDPRGELENAESAGRHDEGRPRSEHLGARWMILGGVIFPTVVLTVLFVMSLRTLGALSPRRGDPPMLTIEVTGKQWWWEVRYLDDDPSRIAITANELRIPVGQRVRILLRASDVIHSFWVPGLQGKTDMIPGRTNVTWLEANRPGQWRGQCAEYCGLQHAKMALVVVAEPPDVFDAWLALQRAPARDPADATGIAAQAAFLKSGCVLCHTVRGTVAHGRVGPDLTHVASRVTLAAGILPNTRGHLAGWVANPQALKPGSRMPAVPMDADEFHAILDYLRTLR